ncbi:MULTISPECIES: hypothetical protein [unclassified Nocardia]|uniref:hypothetical protein n=1 Tax=unclassified Nocardia TaxID=2637762 RepID=UPI001CE49059|nr:MULTISPECIES: hypothetical protein [unclassified Nocardia]
MLRRSGFGYGTFCRRFRAGEIFGAARRHHVACDHRRGLVRGTNRGRRVGGGVDIRGQGARSEALPVVVRDAAGYRAGLHALDEFAHRHLDGDLGGLSGGLRRFGQLLRLRQCCRRLDGETGERTDDHQFGVLDIAGTIPEVLAERTAFFDETVQRTLIASDPFPVFGQPVVGLALAERGEHIAHQPLGIGFAAVERGGHLLPRGGGTPHRGLVALRPIPLFENQFRGRAQGIRDLDTHIRSRARWWRRR